MILMTKNKLKVSENRVLGRIFVPKRDEMVRGLRKLHTEELHNVYSIMLNAAIC